MITEHGHNVETPSENKIVCAGEYDFINTNIIFNGTGNYLYIEDNVRLKDSTISFGGNNALVYLSSNTKHPYIVWIDAWNGSTVYFGNNSFFNGIMHVSASERQNIIFGNDGVYSFGIWFRTADPHLIYDIETKKRINMSKSVLVGDHVWLGQNATILKGSQIGSGSIVAANALISGKTVESNSLWGGNPARKIKDNIFFTGDSVHNYTKKKTKQSMSCSKNEFVYSSDDENIDWKLLFKELTSLKSTDDKLEYIKSNVVANQAKNRFYVASHKKNWVKSIFR